MAGTQHAVTVTTTATRLDTATETDDRDGSSIAVYNNSAVTVYIGMTSAVTTATGAPVLAGSWGPTFTFDTHGDALYGIVASGTADVRVLESGI